MNRRLFSFLVLPATVFSLNMAAAQQHNPSYGRLEAGIQKLRSMEGLRHASWGLCVIRVSDGQVVGSFNSEAALIPASALKVAVTYPAWEILGKDSRFITRLERDARPGADSVLQGSLYITGGGDPCLGSERFPGLDADNVFHGWAQSLLNQKIRHVVGAVIGDPGIYSDELIPGGWLWEDIGNYYAAGTCGLNFHENMYVLRFNPGENTGQPAKIVAVDPAVPGLEFINRVSTGPEGSGDRVIIYGAPQSTLRVLRGTVPLGEPGFMVKGAVPDPPLLAARYLQHYLLRENIRIDRDATTIVKLESQGIHVSESREVIDSILSPPMKEIVEQIHMKSVNAFAEALLLALGKKIRNDGSYSGGAEAVREFWKEKGIGLEGMIIADGSGLSVLNRMTAGQLASMMRVIGSSAGDQDFVETLNLAGRSGDLKTMFEETAAEGRLRAKSGYMKNVRSYAGLVNNRSGEKLAFSVIVNHYSGNQAELKKALERFMAALAE